MRKYFLKGTLSAVFLLSIILNIPTCRNEAKILITNYKDLYVVTLYHRMVVCNLSSQYKKDKHLIEPYFDEAYYKKHYQSALDKSGLPPIDHFMQQGWQGNWKTHKDPNNWFNVTLYKDRLCPCAGNPFVDFMSQPIRNFQKDAKSVKIYVKDEGELKRAWIAAEGFLRQGLCKPIVSLCPKKFTDVPVCLKPMQSRGFHVDFSNTHALSFYKSEFLKDPKAFGIDIKNLKEYQGVYCLLHHMHSPLYPIINPFIINIADASNEPSFASPYGDKFEHSIYLKRVASGYDLVFLHQKIGAKNEYIVPGYIDTFVKQEEVPIKKEFSVSFLLSLGSKGDDTYFNYLHQNYYLRKDLWDKQNELNISKKFYVSRRDINQYSKKYHDLTLPTNSKKWIFYSQYSIQIENAVEYNYLSEKLPDCFLSLTVPIYIGCPNVTDYFDERGMFIAHDIDDVMRITNSLTPETYAQMLPYILENKQKALDLLSLKDKYISEFFEKYIK